MLSTNGGLPGRSHICGNIIKLEFVVFSFQHLFVKEAVKIENTRSSIAHLLEVDLVGWFRQQFLVFPQPSSWRLSKLNCMSTSLEPGQPECLPVRINPSTHMFSVSKSMLGSLVPGTSPGIHVLPANIAMQGRDW